MIKLVRPGTKEVIGTIDEATGKVELTPKFPRKANNENGSGPKTDRNNSEEPKKVGKPSRRTSSAKPRSSKSSPDTAATGVSEETDEASD